MVIRRKKGARKDSDSNVYSSNESDPYTNANGNTGAYYDTDTNRNTCTNNDADSDASPTNANTSK